MSTVLVLNYDYTPLNVTSIRRGFVLVDKGKAEVVKSDESPIMTSYKIYIRPVIIRLLKYIKIHSPDHGTGKSPGKSLGQGPGYFLRTVMPGAVPVKYRIGTVQCVRNGKITVNN